MHPDHLATPNGVLGGLFGQGDLLPGGLDGDKIVWNVKYVDYLHGIHCCFLLWEAFSHSRLKL